MSFRSVIIDNIKNVISWKTDRKIIVLAVDDYGGVRLASKQAREKMDQAGLKVLSRFDAYDALESKEDLLMLYEALRSVKDRNGRAAVFTPFALPCNINFEKMQKDGYQKYEYELLPQTYEKLSAYDPPAYEGAWKLWQQGIKEELLAPQFHGREHLNLRVFEEKLERRDAELMVALKNRSYTSIANSGYSSISVTAAFEFWSLDENQRFREIIKTGLEAFKTVYGYAATHFNPPGGREHPTIHIALKENGIGFINAPWVKHEHQGLGRYKVVINFNGKRNALGQMYLVKNVVFEPTYNRHIDWVRYAMSQIEAAFRWNCPAIISSHRVNFCGHIDPENRKAGIVALKSLLKNVALRWPDIEFMTSEQLGKTMRDNNRLNDRL